MCKHKKITSCLLGPFIVLWRLIALIIGLTGRLIAIVLGLILMIAGAIISSTVIGVVVGIPLIVVGFLLVIRGLF